MYKQYARSHNITCASNILYITGTCDTLQRACLSQHLKEATLKRNLSFEFHKLVNHLTFINSFIILEFIPMKLNLLKISYVMTGIV